MALSTALNTIFAKVNDYVSALRSGTNVGTPESVSKLDTDQHIYIA